MTNLERNLQIFDPAFEGKIGVARCDITPPLGIYARMWASAEHDVAEGVHRSLTATVLSFQAINGGKPFVIVALDLGWWSLPEHEWFIRGAMLEALSIDESRLLIHLSHTHAGPSTALGIKKPGSDKIEPYLRSIREMLIKIAREAVDTAELATLSWSTGRCDLASNRDLPVPDRDTTVCGFNPHKGADDTVLVGRVTDGSGQIIATLVNYACHPTTLGGENRLISPDYIGAMRETIEGSTQGAPCLFLYGAGGELAPRQQYVKDTSIADQNGRQLGYAAMSVLNGMLPPRMGLCFKGVKESGTSLGCWGYVAQDLSTALEATQIVIDLTLRKKMTEPAELIECLEESDEATINERLERHYFRQKLTAGSDGGVPLWVWRLGDVFLVGTPSEPHSPLQVQLRKRFPNRAVIVMSLVNGSLNYLPPAEDYRTHSYETKVAMFESGCLEKTRDACIDVMQRLDTPQLTDRTTRIESENHIDSPAGLPRPHAKLGVRQGRD